MSRRIVVMPQFNDKPTMRVKGQQSNVISSDVSNEVESGADRKPESREPRRAKRGSIHVIVEDRNSTKPIINASVKIYKEGTAEEVVDEKTTDKDGNVVFDNLTASEEMEPPYHLYHIVIEAPGYESVKIMDVEIIADETSDRMVRLGRKVDQDVSPDANRTRILHSMETAPPSSTSSDDINAVVSEPEQANGEEESASPNLSPQTGRLRVDVTNILRSRPIVGATVRIFYEGQTGTPLQEVVTGEIGRTDELTLATPNVEFSLEPSAEQPYATYDLFVEAPGYESVEINSVEVLPGVLAIQNINMMPLENAQGESAILYVIPPHTLFGEYPPKIAESEIKPPPQSGEIVLSKVVVPEYVVVHDGPPSDQSAANYYVKYRDYVKNVASSEIYATWPQATIMANVLCIQSFCLNRVYTEWYRNRGYAFTITNSTAYDQKYIPGRNIFDSISEAVDQVFSNYLARPDVEQPILTQFCDGRRVTCPNWLSQWGSKELGEQGYSAIDIIRYYYGDDMYIATAQEVSGVPASWPGVDLQVGTRSDAVRQVQRQLNVISNGYPLIPKISQDGVYGEKTAEAVRVFQEVFDLPATGVVDYPTWYKISEVYVGVSRIAELN